MSSHSVYFLDTVEIVSLFVGSGDENDSNLLTSDHDVISGVLREEFGPSYEALYGSRSHINRYCICTISHITVNDYSRCGHSRVKQVKVHSFFKMSGTRPRQEFFHSPICPNPLYQRGGQVIWLSGMDGYQVWYFYGSKTVKSI